ncbi:MAG: transposase family protein [Gammaproteobacteria bacterium]|nr:transposase family protein [Gammaproteobacteria bacterium]
MISPTENPEEPHKVYIFITPPRGICKACSDNNKKDTTTTQTLPWFKRNGRYTFPYEKHVLLMVINSTIADVSMKEGLGEGAIQGIIDRHIESEVDWKKVKKIGLLGIDEISIKKVSATATPSSQIHNLV